MWVLWYETYSSLLIFRCIWIIMHTASVRTTLHMKFKMVEEINLFSIFPKQVHSAQLLWKLKQTAQYRFPVLWQHTYTDQASYTVCLFYWSKLLLLFNLRKLVHFFAMKIQLLNHLLLSCSSYLTIKIEVAIFTHFSVFLESETGSTQFVFWKFGVFWYWSWYKYGM